MTQEFKIVGKIDLSKNDDRRKHKKTEETFDFSEFHKPLDEKVEKMSQDINQRYYTVDEENKRHDFVKNDASIDMDGYPNSFFDRQKADKYINDLEKIFMDKVGQNKVEWESSRENKSGIMAEKTAVVLLHKVLGEGFLVVRSSRYDDYKGYDTFIVDLETGNPICGVDEMGANDTTSLMKKGDKIYDRVVSKNGAYIQYGAIIRDQKLERRSLKNVPAFYLAIDRKDLAAVLPHISEDETNTEELRVVQGLVSSLEQQLKNLYWEFDGESYEDLKKRKDELKQELEELKKGNDGIFPQTEEGRSWKKEMGKNNLKMNIMSFKKSLAKMKALAGIK